MSTALVDQVAEAIWGASSAFGLARTWADEAVPVRQAYESQARAALAVVQGTERERRVMNAAGLEVVGREVARMNAELDDMHVARAKLADELAKMDGRIDRLCKARDTLQDNLIEAATDHEAGSRTTSAWKCRLAAIIDRINAADDGDEPPTLREIYLIAQGRA